MSLTTTMLAVSVHQFAWVYDLFARGCYFKYIVYMYCV